MLHLSAVMLMAAILTIATSTSIFTLKHDNTSRLLNPLNKFNPSNLKRIRNDERRNHEISTRELRVIRSLAAIRAVQSFRGGASDEIGSGQSALVSILAPEDESVNSIITSSSSGTQPVFRVESNLKDQENESSDEQSIVKQEPKSEKNPRKRNKSDDLYFWGNFPRIKRRWSDKSSSKRNSGKGESVAGKQSLEKHEVEGEGADGMSGGNDGISSSEKNDPDNQKDSESKESSKDGDKDDRALPASEEVKTQNDNNSKESETTSDANKKAAEVDEKKDEDEESINPSTNQTRPTVLYLSPPSHQHHHPNSLPPGAMMQPLFPPRTMPYANPYMYPPHPHQQPPPQQSPQKPSSLLSSLLSALLPHPPNNSPPSSPYGPSHLPAPYPSPPSSPSNNNEVTILLTTILSLLLRIALLSLTTHILDFFGLGGLGGSNSNGRDAAFLPTPAQHYTFERVNDRYRRDGSALMQALESPPPGVGKYRWRRVLKRRRSEAVRSFNSLNSFVSSSTFDAAQPPSLANGELYNRTVIILDMKPDSKLGNGVSEQLRDTVSFIIEQHRDHLDRRRNGNKNANPFYPNALNVRTTQGLRPTIGGSSHHLEILLLLDSPGGTVQDYGLASSHLSRLRNEPHITLSVSIDRVAASGGYMMACQATPGQLFAAPFAMVGSIGVLMETVNVNEVLNKYGVKPLVIKAGKNKAPLKTLGEVTDEELEMAQKDAEAIHEAFQEWVLKSRPNVNVSKEWLEKVCTGSVFLGKEAKELGLVDRVMTSDEYVAEKIERGDRVLRLVPYKGPQFGLKLSPLDLLLLGTDAEGRAASLMRIRQTMRGFGLGVMGWVAPLVRVGSAVGVLNLVHHLASLRSSHSDFSWAA